MIEEIDWNAARFDSTPLPEAWQNAPPPAWWERCIEQVREILGRVAGC